LANPPKSVYTRDTRTTIHSNTITLLARREGPDTALLSFAVIADARNPPKYGGKDLRPNRRREHVSPLLRELHWLRVPERIDFHLAVLVYRYMNGTAPRYVGSELQRVADIEASAICIVTVAACSTVVAQDHRRSRLPRFRGKDLECAAAVDHVAAVAGGIQACTEDGTFPQIIRQRKLSATVALTLQL